MTQPTFPYDPEILQVAQIPPTSIPEMVDRLQRIDQLCSDGDGLRWFNHLYLQITQAVLAQVDAGGFQNTNWMRQLDVEFGKFYLNALGSMLTSQPCPACWSAMFGVRKDVRIARIQFALAGVNAHINRDLPQALIKVGELTGIQPHYGTPEYQDYVSVNATLQPFIQQARTDLHVRLLGDALPDVSHVENTVGLWSLVDARAAARNYAEALLAVQGTSAEELLLDSLDRTTKALSLAVLVPAP